MSAQRGHFERVTGSPLSSVERQRLVQAIDVLHERAWADGADGADGDLVAHKAADALADALGWRGDHGTTPDGPWLRERLSEVLR